ncbi:MAG: monovalent cation/H(+) antiporter subunit G [Christensenellales bacterium]
MSSNGGRSFDSDGSVHGARSVCLLRGRLRRVQLKYAANRMHAAALNDTMGISLCLVGLAISAPDVFTALKILLVVVFLWLASPVASHLLCRLEVETNEQRGEYMNVHEQTLAQERAQAAQAEESEEARGGEEEQA